jgi:hypothetical protein
MSVSVDELRDFLGRLPPRQIPPDMRKSALRRSPLSVALAGLAFIAFSIPFMIVFFPWRLADDLRLNAHARVTHDAVVDVRSETNMRENSRRVYKYEFSFTPDGGPRRKGMCYETGGSADAGSQVAVEYLPSDRAVARMQGSRLTPFGWGAVFVLLFPVFGGTFVFFTLRSRRRLVALLTDGRFSAGRIESVEGTSVSVNNQQRFRVTVSFKSAFAAHTGQYYAYGDNVALAEKKRAEGAVVGLLYDASNPQRVFLTDELLNP